MGALRSFEKVRIGEARLGEARRGGVRRGKDGLGVVWSGEERRG